MRAYACVTWLKIFQKFLDEEGGSTHCTVLETLFQDEHLVLPKFAFSNCFFKIFLSLKIRLSNLGEPSITKETGLRGSRGDTVVNELLTSQIFPWSLFNVMIHLCLLGGQGADRHEENYKQNVCEDNFQMP